MNNEKIDKIEKITRLNGWLDIIQDENCVYLNFMDHSLDEAQELYKSYLNLPQLPVEKNEVDE